jgi:hypothetical protein
MNYTAHGTARVSIVAAPELFGKRLGHLATKGEYSWALRDFITGKILRSGDSALTLSDIEAMVVDSWYPKYRAVQRSREWATELEQLSIAHFGDAYDAKTPPNAVSGTWRTL